MVAEFSAESIKNVSPQVGKKLVFVQGTAAINSDFITVPELSIVEGAFVVATNGTVGTCTFATNVITVTNAGALTWSGLAWGY